MRLYSLLFLGDLLTKIANGDGMYVSVLLNFVRNFALECSLRASNEVCVIKHNLTIGILAFRWSLNRKCPNVIVTYSYINRAIIANWWISRQ